jgi:hypothetical protein
MKKILIIVALVLVGIGSAWAQPRPDQPSVPEGFSGTRVFTDTAIIDIQIKALIPDISILKLKTDTYNKPGVYGFTINMDTIQAESQQQLIEWREEINIWLEESK